MAEETKQAEISKEDKYYKMYTDIWKYHKKYVRTICSDAGFWDNLVEEGSALAKKYDNCEFIKNLVGNEMSEIDRMAKELKAAGKLTEFPKKA